RGALGGDLLVALVDVGLDHDADDGVFALAQLVGDDLGDLGLVVVVLLGVAYRCIRDNVVEKKGNGDGHIPCEQSTMMACFWPLSVSVFLAAWTLSLS